MMKPMILAVFAALLCLAPPALARDLNAGLEKAVYARGIFAVMHRKYLTMTDGDCLLRGARLRCDEALDQAVRLVQGYENSLLDTAKSDLGTATVTVLPSTARLSDLLGALASNMSEADTIVAAYREAGAR